MVQTVYSEVYSILNMLGEEYIDKLPPKLVEFIEKEKVASYSPVYTLDKSIEEQNISEDALAMITFFNLKYWCQADEKEELLKILQRNEKQYKMFMATKINTINDEEKNAENIVEKDIKKEIMPLQNKDIKLIMREKFVLES